MASAPPTPVAFTREISLGQIIQLITIAGPLLVWGITVEKRLERQDVQIQAVQTLLTNNLSHIQRNLDDLKDEVRRRD